MHFGKICALDTIAERSHGNTTHFPVAPGHNSRAGIKLAPLHQGLASYAQMEPAGPLKLTCGEVDVGKEDDVGGDQRNQLCNANLLLEVDMDNVLFPQGAVGAGVQNLEAGA